MQSDQGVYLSAYMIIALQLMLKRKDTREIVLRQCVEVFCMTSFMFKGSFFIETGRVISVIQVNFRCTWSKVVQLLINMAF